MTAIASGRATISSNWIARSPARSILADSVQDDPLQLILAALLRIDGLRSAAPSASAELDAITGLLTMTVDRLRALIIALTSGVDE